jgi:hypothetical protein
MLLAHLFATVSPLVQRSGVQAPAELAAACAHLVVLHHLGSWNTACGVVVSAAILGVLGLALLGVPTVEDWDDFD